MNKEQFLADALRITDLVLTANGDRLTDLGVVASKDFVKSGESAELAVYFYRGMTLVDVIQTELTRDGEPLGSSDDVRSWLIESIDQVLVELSAPPMPAE